MATKIYALRNKTSNQIYIGSTKQKLNHRFNHHTGHFKEYQQGKRKDYVSAYDIMKCPTAYIELIEECSEDNRYERERYWIENTPNCLNTNIPIRSKTELKEYHKKWAEENRERLRDYQREYMRKWRALQSDLKPINITRDIVD